VRRPKKNLKKNLDSERRSAIPAKNIKPVDNIPQAAEFKGKSGT